MSLPSKILLSLITALLVAAAGYRLGVKLTMERWQADKLVQADANLKAIQTARETEQTNAKRVQDAQSTQIKSLANRSADNDRATDERDRLRDQIHSITSSADTASTANQRAAAIGELFGACVAEYQGMARVADGHAVDVKMLMSAWPR